MYKSVARNSQVREGVGPRSDGRIAFELVSLGFLLSFKKRLEKWGQAPFLILKFF